MVEGDQTARSTPGGDPLLGKVLNGRFRILEKLGAGGMGTVYKAVQTPLDRIVALKVLNSNYDSKRDPGFQRRFFLEASVTSKLKHPNTITVIDYGKTDDGIYFIAMEYLEGITLAQVLTQDGPLPWNRALHIIQQVARSLREAHKSGIIHRDLKPANVMICNEETDHDLVKVLDFGLVKSFAPESVQSSGHASELTQAGVFLGSPQYMAPEQARNLADPRSDIYSLGVVTYQMLMGRPPFFAEQSIDVIVKHMKEPPQPFNAARPDLDVPPEVEALVMKCLEKSPDKRYQSMDELLEGIRSAALGNGISGAFSGSRTPAPMSQSGAHRLPATSGPRPTTSGPHRPPGQSGVRVVQAPSSGVHKGGASLPLDISVEDGARQTDPSFPAVQDPVPPPRARKLLPLWIFLGSATLGLIVVFALSRGGPTPTPVPPPVPPPLAHVEPPPPVVPPPVVPPPVTPPQARPAEVKFRVTSEPIGARVLNGKKDMGRTPLEFALPPNEGGIAEAELTFTLDGYQSTSAIARGSGVVLLEQRLRRKPPPPPPNPKNTTNSRYKPDPYQ